MGVQQPERVPIMVQQTQNPQPLGPTIQTQPTSSMLASQIHATPTKHASIQIVWWTISIIGGTALLLVSAYLLFPMGKIEIETQVRGKSIHVKKLALTRPGGLVIYSLSPEYGTYQIAGTVLLDPEEYIDFDLPLLDNQTDIPSGQYYAEIYTDADQNGGVDSTSDMPMKDVLGRTIRTSFLVQ